MKKSMIDVTIAYCVESMQCNLAGAGLKLKIRDLRSKDNDILSVQKCFECNFSV